MWTEPVVTTAAASEPVTLTEVKAHCRITSTSEDTLLGTYISAARDVVEKWTGLRLAEQTVTFSRRYFETVMPLPVAPVQSVAITYQDEADATQTLSASLYDLSGVNTLRPVISRADGASWPSLFNTPEAITVTAVVGYEVAPDSIRHAILLLVGQWFTNREVSGDDGEAPYAVRALLENYRTFR